MIEITVDDLKLQEELSKLKDKFEDLSPLMLSLSESMLFGVMENMESEGSRLPSGHWVGLSEWTLEGRAKKGHNGKILQDNGDLINSIHAEHSPTEAIVGTIDKRAAMLHFGGQTGLDTIIPGRPYMELIDQDLDDMMEDVMSYLGK